jgi:hypothetical protein
MIPATFWRVFYPNNSLGYLEEREKGALLCASKAFKENSDILYSALVRNYIVELGLNYFKYVILEAAMSGKSVDLRSKPKDIAEALAKVQSQTLSRLQIERKIPESDVLSPESIRSFVENEKHIRFTNFVRCLGSLGIKFSKKINSYRRLVDHFAMSTKRAAFQNRLDKEIYWELPLVTEVHPLLAKNLKNLKRLDICDSHIYMLSDAFFNHPDTSLTVVYAKTDQSSAENPLGACCDFRTGWEEPESKRLCTETD